MSVTRFDPSLQWKVCANTLRSAGMEEGTEKDRSVSGGKRLSSGNIKRNKALKRKLFCGDDENTSPVLGLRILPVDELKKSARTTDPADENITTGESTKFTCKLCRMAYADPLELANHSCARIENVQYSCPDCGKSFSCPANLASHRRWHRPRGKNESSNADASRPEDTDRNTAATSNGEANGIRGNINRRDLNPLTSQKPEPGTNELHHGCTVDRKSNSKDDAATKHEGMNLSETCATSAVTMLQRKGNFVSGSTREIYFKNDFGGLAALAFAAEMHSLFSPGRAKTNQANNTKPRELTTRRISSENANCKLTCCKGTRTSSGDEERAKTSIPKVPMWLPPSPPRSDQSCSPHSAMSDENEERILLNNIPLLANVSSRHSGSKEESKESNPERGKRESTVYNNHFITHAGHIPFQSTISIAKFQEPYHPFVFAPRPLHHEPNFNSNTFRHWSSWRTYSAPPAYFPYSYLS